MLVTASLTCNVARRQQTQVDELRQRFGNAVAVVVVYTIDAHPAGDPCPYTGEEWVPEDNRKDQVLIHQPKTLAERLDAARTFQKRFSTNATVLVDMMDDAAWKALGSAPNLGLLVGSDGIVRLRQGWFDAEAMTKETPAMGLVPNPPKAHWQRRHPARARRAARFRCTAPGAIPRFLLKPHEIPPRLLARGGCGSSVHHAASALHPLAGAAARAGRNCKAPCRRTPQGHFHFQLPASSPPLHRSGGPSSGGPSRGPMDCRVATALRWARA